MLCPWFGKRISNVSNANAEQTMDANKSKPHKWIDVEWHGAWMEGKRFNIS